MSLRGPTAPDPVDVLVVDDRPDNLLALRSVLDSPAYRVITASSGAAALGAVAEHDFAVILLDALMPGMSGIETAPQLREHPRGREVPIIFVTGALAGPDSLRRAYAAGAVDYLVKPIEPAVVQAKVAVFAELFRQRRRIEEQAALLHEAERQQVSSTRAELLAAEKRARAEAEASERRWAFIAEASSQLSASLDYETTLVTVARLAVPHLCDWCVGYVVEADGRIRRQAVAHQDAANEDVAVQLRRGHLILADAHAVAEAIRTGRSWMQPRLSERDLRALVSEAADLETLRRLGLRSMMIVPLRARGKVLGALSLSSTRSDRTYTDADLAVAEDLASHAALAVDNARLYHEANEAIRARDEFLSIAAHELRTPLTALQLQVQSLGRSLKRRLVDDASRRTEGKIRVAERQLERLGRLVEELLDVSRITTGRLRLELEPVSMSALARDVLARMSGELDLARCEVALHAADRAEGRWDRLRVEQVLTNLLSNAAKYGAGQPIDVTVQSEAGSVLLAVTDHGIGVSPELRESIFERFGRAVPQRDYPGLGLGLYICRQIVDAHGGCIRVESTPGRGSTFTVALPAEATTPPLPTRPGRSP